MSPDNARTIELNSPNTLKIWRFRVEVVGHVFSRELAESTSLEAEELKHFVDFREIQG